MKVIECVPNFSEGRREEVIRELQAAIASVEAVRLLDIERDPSHNRSVFTFVGSDPQALREAALRAARVAVARIDLTRHSGEHPRMGALDVCPFVPIAGVEMHECVRLARETARRLADELSIPVFLYERAALRPERRDLAAIRTRTRQFEQLRDLVGRDPRFEPDLGPRAVHPTAGCTAVGARPPLIAYNVNLESSDIALARSIAKAIRERDGGLPGIKALGMWIETRGVAQVSVNVCDYRATSLLTVFREIERLALRAGAGIRSSEIVGLVPAEALPDEWRPELRLEGFDPSRQIIENRL